jgi:hypothetical protein
MAAPVARWGRLTAVLGAPLYISSNREARSTVVIMTVIFIASITGTSTQLFFFMKTIIQSIYISITACFASTTTTATAVLKLSGDITLGSE